MPMMDKGVPPAQIPRAEVPRAEIPRVLLVEDDPTSRLFLTAALTALPAQVDTADTFAAALALAQHQDYALWMIDARLPDGTGPDLLARLRNQHPHTPALAHTAANDLHIQRDLRAAGFVDVLVKPMTIAQAQAGVRAALGAAPVTDQMPAAESSLVLWDDASAERALNGNRAHVDTLRALFVGELPKAVEAIAGAAAREDIDGVRSDLHRLRASCGFVGAMRLAATVQALQDEPDSAMRLVEFERTAADTLTAASAQS